MKRTTPFSRWSNGGFTLIELMVVIVILGILAGIIVPKIMDRPDDAKRMKARVDIEGIKTALKLYKLDNGAYPSTEQGLDALVTMPEPPPKNWKKGGYLDKLPKDPWGNEYMFLSPGQHDEIDILCYGADGVPDGEDANADIRSWELD